MNKLFFLLVITLFFTCSFSFSQNEEVVAKEKKSNFLGAVYINAGLSHIPSFNLSQNLTRDGLINLDNRFYNVVGLGTRFELNRFSLSMEANATRFDKKEDNNVYRFRGYTGKLDLSYLAFGSREFGLEIGATTSYTTSSMFLFSQNTTLNLNTVSPSTQTGSLEIQYKPLGLGGNVALLMSEEGSKINGDITFSYQRVINQAQWTSEYANVENAPTEQGQNIFSLTARFYLFRKNLK